MNPLQNGSNKLGHTQSNDSNGRYSDVLRRPPIPPNKKLPLIEEVVGDLFENSCSSNIVHCVGKDLQMRRGFANQIRKQFGRIEYLRSQRKQVGDVAVLPEGPRYIFYLITKQSTSDHMPELENVRVCLQTLRTLCDDYKLKELSMPRICSGLDFIPWPTVKSLITEVFTGSKIKITIYRLHRPRPIPHNSSTGHGKTPVTNHSGPETTTSGTTTTTTVFTSSTTIPISTTTTTTTTSPSTSTVNSTSTTTTSLQKPSPSPDTNPS
ncbi:hypothetical protein B566_EDAN007468 [Ephemera danica]|nr:hypothetical protein B566_EDAN007468 [Ephemera danica]